MYSKVRDTFTWRLVCFHSGRHFWSHDIPIVMWVLVVAVVNVVV